MADTGFTPGPWAIAYPAIYAVGKGPRVGRVASVSIAYKDTRTYEANARLGSLRRRTSRKGKPMTPSQIINRGVTLVGVGLCLPLWAIPNWSWAAASPQPALALRVEPQSSLRLAGSRFDQAQGETR